MYDREPVDRRGLDMSRRHIRRELLASLLQFEREGRLPAGRTVESMLASILGPEPEPPPAVVDYTEAANDALRDAGCVRRVDGPLRTKQALAAVLFDSHLPDHQLLRVLDVNRGTLAVMKSRWRRTRR